MTNDLVSDMLTRIRNASMARHSFARVRYSKLNLAILKVLSAEGYIKSYAIESQENKESEIKILLKYKGWWIKKPFFSILQRISKPGQRVFSGYKHKSSNFTNSIFLSSPCVIISPNLSIARPTGWLCNQISTLFGVEVPDIFAWSTNGDDFSWLFLKFFSILHKTSLKSRTITIIFGLG